MIFLRKHGIAFFLSLMVGLVYASHHFFIPFLLDSRSQVYYPITFAAYYDEAILYAPRAHAAFLGQWIVGDFSLAEYPRGPSLLPILNPLVLGKFSKIMGSMRVGLMASDFLFPALIFLIIYFLLWEIVSRRTPALIFSSLFIFFPKLGIYIPPVTALNFQELIKSFLPFLRTDEALYFTQFEEPKITFVFMALAFYLACRAIKRNECLTTYLAGASFGILFYTYLYDWVSYLAALVIMGIIFLFKKDYGRLKQVAIIAGIGAAISFFYWYNLWQILQTPQHSDIFARGGGEFSHQIRFFTVWKSYLRALVLVFGLWLFWRKPERNIFIFLSSFLLAYFAVVNLQVVTGFNPQPDHWYRVQFLPIALAVFLIILRLFDIVSGSKQTVLASLFLLYFYAAVIYSQAMHSLKYADAYAISKDRMASYEWLNKNTPKGSVVATLSLSANRDIQLHTHNKIFLPFGFSTLAPDEELWERFMFIARIFAVSPADFANLTREEMAYYLFAEKYGSHEFDSSFRGYQRKMPDSVAEEKISEYKKYLQSPSLDIPYKVDYVYLPAEKNSWWQDPAKTVLGLQEVYRQGDIKIYQW